MSALELLLSSKLFPVVREAFSNEYPDREVQNKKTIHLFLSKFENTTGVFLDDLSSGDKTALK